MKGIGVVGIFSLCSLNRDLNTFLFIVEGRRLNVVETCNKSLEWRSGESTRLQSMWPGFDSQTRRHMWVEFVGSLLCIERFFSGYSGFPPKNQHLI